MDLHRLCFSDNLTFDEVFSSVLLFAWSPPPLLFLIKKIEHFIKYVCVYDFLFLQGTAGSEVLITIGTT
jgi:hypothetical protein